jgi:hypothetical protein
MNGNMMRHLVGEAPGRGVVLQNHGLAEDGDEGRRQGTLGEQVAQQVGDAERDGERVHDAAAAEQRRKHLLANQAEHAAAEHRQPDDPGRAGIQPLGACLRPGRRGGAVRRCVACCHVAVTVAFTVRPLPVSARCARPP